MCDFLPRLDAAATCFAHLALPVSSNAFSFY